MARSTSAHPSLRVQAVNLHAIQPNTPVTAFVIPFITSDLRHRRSRMMAGGDDNVTNSTVSTVSAGYQRVTALRCWPHVQVDRQFPAS